MLPRLWVINQAIILDVSFKEVPKTGWADMPQQWNSAEIIQFLLVHTVCTSCSLENSFSESLVLFHFSFHILEFKSFVWIWSVWKCSMKCLLYVSYDSRGTKKYCCRSEQWPANPYVQLLGYWKMYRKWISDSASAVFMTGMFLKEFSLNVIILLLPLKSDWIFHLNEITFPFL